MTNIFPKSIRNNYWTLLFDYKTIFHVDTLIVQIFGEDNSFTLEDTDGSILTYKVYCNGTQYYNDIDNIKYDFVSSSDFIRFIAVATNNLTQVFISNVKCFQGICVSQSSMVTSNNNIFMGVSSGYSNTSGENNIFIGYKTGYLNTGGNNNILLGPYTGYNNTNSTFNVAIGDNAFKGYPGNVISATVEEFQSSFNSYKYVLKNILSFRNSYIEIDSTTVFTSNSEVRILNVSIHDVSLIDKLILSREVLQNNGMYIEDATFTNIEITEISKNFKVYVS